MTETFSSVLPGIFSTVSLFGLQTIVATLKKSGSGVADNPILTSAVSILGNVAGARVDAGFVNWLRRNGQKWIDRTGKVDPNHTLPRAVFLSSCMACYVAGKRFAKKKNLKTRDWGGPFSLCEQWFEHVVDHMPHSMNDTAPQAWLEAWLTAVVEDYKSIAKSDWAPNGLGDLSAKTGHLADRLELLVRGAEGKGVEPSVGMDAADLTLAHLLRRHGLALPPVDFESDFRSDWFEVLCLDFVARLRADTPTFNMFVASQLAALQIERPRLPDGALDELRAILDSALRRIEGKIDRIIDTELPDLRVRLDRIQDGVSGLANRRSPEEPAPMTEPPNLPPWGELPGVLKSLPRRHHMPYESLGDRFISRTRDLWLIHDAIEAKGLAVATGTGGLGKTQLAIEYVWRFGRCYPGGVFWVEAERGRGRIVEQVAPFADVTIEGSLQEEDQIRLLWKKLATSPVLVVLNNFLDDAFLRDWRPPEGLISVLVTARRRDIAPESEVPLAFFKPEESLALLNSGARRYSANEAAPLIEEIGGLPLPLELARGNLESQPSLSIDRFMDQLYGAGYSQMWSRIAEKYRDQLPTRHGKSVMATFQLSWERIESDDAREVVQAITELAPDPVPLWLLQRVPGFRGPEGAEELQLAVDELVRISLADRVGIDSIQVHRLILGFVRECDPGEWELGAQVAQAVADEMELIDDEVSIVQNARALQSIAPHAVVLYDSDRCAGRTKFRLAAAMSTYQRHWGRYREALEWARAVLGLAERYHRAEPDIVSGARSWFGWSLNSMGQHRQAAQVLREVMEYRSVSAIGDPDPSLARAQFLLGEVLTQLGEYAEAKKLLAQALESFTQEYGPDQHWIASTQNSLGRCLRSLGELQDARRLQEAALTFTEAHFGPGHIETATVQNDLALCLTDLAEYDVAKVFLERSLDSCKSISSDSPDTAVVSAGLAVCSCSLGRYDAGIELLNQALILYEENYSPGHHWIAMTQAQIASALIDVGRYSDAKERLNQSIQSLRISDQPDSSWRSDAKRLQGRTLLRLGQYQGAQMALEEALSVDTARLPLDHPKIASGNAWLALALIKLGDTERGWPLLHEARATLAAKLKLNHADLARLQRDIDALLGAAARPG